MKIYKIDENGYLQFEYDEEINEGEVVPEGFTAVPLPKDDLGNQLPFYKPKLVNDKWIEGATQEEIDAINNQPKEPTSDDYLIDLDFRISMIELGL